MLQHNLCQRDTCVKHNVYLNTQTQFGTRFMIDEKTDKSRHFLYRSISLAAVDKSTVALSLHAASKEEIREKTIISIAYQCIS